MALRMSNKSFIAFQEFPTDISSCRKEHILELTNGRLRRPTDGFPKLTYNLLGLTEATLPGRARYDLPSASEGG